MSENKDVRTASQKIDDLEKVVSMLYQGLTQTNSVLENLLKSQGDIVLLKDALKLLNKKAEAIVQVALPETGITVQSVSDLVVKMNVVDLTAQVSVFVENGHLVAAEEVAGNSYVVCEEVDSDGKIVNPRIQFRLDSQDETTTGLLLGKKVGESVSFGEGKFSAKVLEIYTITEPKPTEPAETAKEIQPEVTPAPAQAELPTENANTFELQYHGQPESTLTTPSA